MRKFSFLSAFALLVLLVTTQLGIVSHVVATTSVNSGNVAFTIPVGENGVHYEGGDLPDTMRWGPLAFTIAPDGSFWIADTAADPDRLLHYNSRGDWVDTINLDDWIVGVSDLIVTDSDILVLAQAPVPPKVVRLGLDGKVLESYDLPKGLYLKDGMSGIALGEKGEVLIERMGGATITQLVDTSGKFSPIDVDGYRHCGHLYTAHLTDLHSENPSSGTITIGDIRIGVKVPNRLGGLRILGVNHDGSFFVVLDEIANTLSFKVDQTVRHYSATGELLGVSRVPMNLRYSAVEHELAVGPDGEVYLMTPQANQVEVLRLQFSLDLRPVLPDVSTGNFAAHNIKAAKGCRSRSSMMSVATSYTNNSKYLDGNDINGSCSGREKPSYLGSPGTYYSVPYDWNGWDTPSQFNNFMNSSSYQAGDTNSSYESCSRGTDCSGFVSRAWGLSSHYGTWNLYNNHSFALGSTGALLQGDIMIKPSSHVILYKTTIDNGMLGYESTTYGNVDRVVYRHRSWSWLSSNGYGPRRYNDVCQ